MRRRTRPATIEVTSTDGNTRSSGEAILPSAVRRDAAAADASVSPATVSVGGCAADVTACWIVWQSRVVAISQATARTSCDPSSPATISSDIKLIPCTLSRDLVVGSSIYYL